MKVLIVDDSSTMRMLVKRTLRMAGFTDLKLVEAENGIEALEVVASESPNLVLCDWNMPEMTGIELLREIRDDISLKEVPMLMVTTEAKKESIVAAVEAGVNNYIVKPFNAETLRTKMGAVLGAF